MKKIISLKSSAETPSLYENAEAIVLFLCKECVDHIRNLSLPEEVFDLIGYQVGKQGYAFTETGKVTSMLVKNGSGYQQIILAGIGAGKECTPNHLRVAAGNAVRELQGSKIKTAVAAGPILKNPKRGHYLKALAEGLLLGSYEFNKYKSEKEKGNAADKNETAGVAAKNENLTAGAASGTERKITGGKVAGKNVTAAVKETISVTIISGIANGEEILKEASVICKTICHARDLANEPGNVINPETLAEEAVETAEKHNLETEVLTVKEMQKLGMGAILAVGEGSVHEPRMVVLKYANGGDKPFTAFVGKGITFDSGGISIKPSDGMGEMKDDMTGAATVLGAMEAIAELKLPVNVIGIMACAETCPPVRPSAPAT